MRAPGQASVNARMNPGIKAWSLTTNGCVAGEFGHAVKPLPVPDESVLKQKGDYPRINQRGGNHAIHSQPALGPFAQQLPGSYGRAGNAHMTPVVAVLLCISVAVFFAHAFNAYHES